MKAGAPLSEIVLETARLVIRLPRPSDEDVSLFYSLWTDPRVMSFVGFPKGLAITREEIRSSLAKSSPGVFDTKLIVSLKENRRPIGECKLGSPGDDGISETDVKLLPEYWGKGFGTEIKRALVDYLFAHTSSAGVRGTPNKRNIASQRMQEAVGARRVGEGVFRFPPGRREETADVPYVVYVVSREDWEKRKTASS